MLRERDKYSALSMRVVRYTALVLPLLVIVYAFLVEWGYAQKSNWYNTTLTIFICAAILCIAVWQFITKPTSPRSVLINLILFHICGSLFLLYVTGIATPLTLIWVVLIVIADLNYARSGILYSLATLFGITLLDASTSDLSVQTFIVYATYLMLIASITIFLNRLRSVQTVEHDDFKENKELQTVQQLQLNTLLNSINEAIISTNREGVVQVYNAATLNLLDTNQSLAGKRLNDIFQTYNDQGEPVHLFSAANKKSKLLQRDDLEHRFADGEAIRLGISISAIQSNKPSARDRIEGYIFVIRDITKSKSLEEERDEFISVVSHELRTPITITEGTLSNLQLLLERKADTSILNQSLKDAHEQIIYLSKMVNDLSTLSRAERGVADAPERIDVTDLIHDLYEQYEKKATHKGLALDLDIVGKLGTVNVSRLYLEEMIQNFITNSIKYTQKGTVTLFAHRKGENITIGVKDTGIGISKSEQKKVFEKFYRSEDYRTRETSGTGLGLYVVEKLSHKLGTKVAVTSRLNHGSTFSFVLKAAQTSLDDTAPKE